MDRESPVTVRLENVAVRYALPASGARRRTQATAHNSLTALSDITVNFHEGEAVGIVGANGAGKSTLMRVIAGLTPVSQGRVLASSRPVLLTVGGVLVPSASGRDNALVGLLALGMTRRDARAAVPSVLEFAGLTDAADRPLTTYSSGMAARLKFAVASHRPAPIVLLDEALAVGDEEFRVKCRARLGSLRENASTVLLVSHSTATINRLCSRAVLLEKGRLVLDGPASRVTAHYREQSALMAES